MRFSARDCHAFLPLNLSKVNCKAINTAAGGKKKKRGIISVQKRADWANSAFEKTWGKGLIKIKNRFTDLRLKDSMTSINNRHDKTQLVGGGDAVILLQPRRAGEATQPGNALQSPASETPLLSCQPDLTTAGSAAMSKGNEMKETLEMGSTC